jgi:hypothetical protein
MGRSQIFNCDAASFDKYADYNIFYLYNPFPAETMLKVISNIKSSADNSARELRLIYNNPVCHDDIIQQGTFEKIKEYPDEWGNKMYVYCNYSANP